MRTFDSPLARWIADTREVSNGVYLLTVTASDGRKIEVSGVDPEKLEVGIRKSILDSDVQLLHRKGLSNDPLHE